MFMRRLLLTLLFVCSQTQMMQSGEELGGEEEEKRTNYTVEEERALKTKFGHLFKQNKGPGMDDIRQFLKDNKWIKRSETSIRDKCRNMARRQ